MNAQGQSDYVGGLPAGCLLNEYQIERVLGHGGFGVTYLARDTMLQKAVAIKEYLPTEWAVRQQGNSVSVRSSEDRIAFEQGQTSFLNEARVLARFTHPNLIAVYRFFQANGTAYFVMEYAEGETLRAVIKKQGTLDEALIKKLLLPMIHGLDGVHQAGIMHRDIKPENILVRKDHTAVLIDFGAARIATGSKSRAITSVLTAGYAPVEQYSTTGHQGPWTDIYALGAVMYYMICGRKPIDAISRMGDDTLVPAALAGQGRYSPEFLAAMDWALRVKAEDRPQTLNEWRLALDGSQPAPRLAMTPAVESAAVTRPGRLPVTVDPTVKVAAPESRAAPPPATATRIATPASATAPPMTAATAPTAAPATVHAASVRSSAPLWSAAAAFAVAGAGIAGWYISRLAAPPAPAQTQAAPAVAAPATEKSSDSAAQAKAQELARQKALELRQQQADAERQKQLDTEKLNRQQEQELARQKTLELQQQQKAAEQQKQLEQARAQQAELERKKREQERLEAQKREEERLAAEQRAQEQLDQKKKAEAERQAKIEEKQKRSAKEQARRAAEEEENKKKPEDDAPVGF